MKIAVISAARTRSSALTTFLSETHPELEYLWEFYSRNITALKKTDRDQITEELFRDHDHFLVKILGQNFSLNSDLPGKFVGDENIRPERMRLENYDFLYLIERHDYFHQLCSYVVAYYSRIFNQLKSNPADRFAEFRNQKFDITHQATTLITGDIAGYMRIKKYVIDNGLPFQLYNSEMDLTEDISEKARTKIIDRDYSILVNNYHSLKPKFEEAFARHFNYETCQRDYDSFINEVNDILSS
jgi:hypothetical protein